LIYDPPDFGLVQSLTSENYAFTRDLLKKKLIENNVWNYQ